jgi:hypothetical protein
MKRRFWRWVARQLAPYIAADLYRALESALAPKREPDPTFTSTYFSRGCDDILVAVHPSIDTVE